MNSYELTYLKSPTASNNIVSIDQIRKIIEEKKGVVVTTKTKGDENVASLFQKINLAYPIKKNRSADIVTIEFSIDPIEIKEIVEKIRLNKDILRYILIKQAGIGIQRKIRRERKDPKIENKEDGLRVLKKEEKEEKENKKIFNTILNDEEKKDIEDIKVLKTKKTKKEKIKLEEIGEKLNKIL